MSLLRTVVPVFPLRTGKNVEIIIRIRARVSLSLLAVIVVGVTKEVIPVFPSVPSAPTQDMRNLIIIIITLVTLINGHRRLLELVRQSLLLLIS